MQNNLSHTARENIIRRIVEKHPDWVLKASDFMAKYSSQMNLYMYCIKQNLPYNDFKDFYDMLIADIKEEIDANPFLKQISSLPAQFQNEYSSLSRKRRELTMELAEIYSKIIGKKVEIRDFYDKDKSLEIDTKLKKILDHNNVDHLVGALRSKQLFNEIDAIDTELERFYHRHGIR